MRFLLLLLPAILLGQFDYFGYVEIEGDQLQLGDNSYQFGYGKLRLDAQWRPAEYLLIAGNVNTQTYLGQTEWDFLDFLPYNSVLLYDSVGLVHDTLYSLPVILRDSTYLDNLNLRLNLPFADVTLGRQPISLGTGYAWNPLDIFNQKDMLDPTYEQPGVDAVRMEIPLNDHTGIDIIVANHDSMDTGTKMLQLKTGLGSFDFTANLAHHYQLFPYWRFMNELQTQVTIALYGGSFVGQVWELGFWGEMLWSPNDIYGHWEYVLGVDHTLDNGLYLMVEYFHNTLGATTNELSFDNYIHAFKAESKSLMQNYILALTIFAFNNFISGSFMVYGNLDDGSFTLAHQVEWSALENLVLSFLVSKSVGEQDTEFGLQDQAFRMRVRAYF